MELLDLASLRGRAQRLSSGATQSSVYPTTASTSNSLVALDLLEVEPGSSTPAQTTPEEHFLCVLSGSGTLTGGTNGPEAQLRSGSVIHLAPREPHTITASGREPLRVLVVTSLVVLSDRALGLTPTHTTETSHTATPSARTETPRERLYVAETPAPGPERAERGERTERHEPASRREEPRREETAAPSTPPLTRNTPAPTASPTTPTPVTTTSAAASEPEDDGPRPDLTQVSGLRKASDLAGQPKPERRRPAPLPEPTPAPEPAQPEEEGEEDEDRGLMELNVVFDGGSRGNPGQGYGSYMVQSPGRKPVVKRAEFGPNYTNNQAEYESLIACLHYVIDRLTATNRTPDGVALDIKTDSDLVANQLQGTYKVKDAGLRSRHQQAMDLLDQFGAWQIEWQPREETEKQLGH